MMGIRSPERRFVALAAGALVLGLAIVWPSTLILPAVAMLLMGWIDGVAHALERRTRPRILAWTVALVLWAETVAVGAAISPRERLRQDALAAAEAALSSSGGHLLGLGDAAFAAGLLARAPVIWAAPGAHDADIVLCATETESVRLPIRSRSCDLPGYTVLREVEPYVIMGRQRR